MKSHVTRTGRAKSPGRVTRKSLQAKRKHDGKPLPIHLQCHPKALTKTRLHPGCATRKHPEAAECVYLLNYTRRELEAGTGLLHGTFESPGPKGKYELVDPGPLGDWGAEHTFGWAESITYAMAWQRAARIRGLTVEVRQS